MQVTEAERHHLYESLKTHLGTASADTLMNLIPPFDWSELATKSDIRRIDDRFDVLSDRMDVLSNRIDDRFEVLSNRIDDRFEVLSNRMDTMSTTMATKADLAVMRADLMRTFGTWLFASQAAVIASVALVVAFLG